MAPAHPDRRERHESRWTSWLEMAAPRAAGVACVAIAMGLGARAGGDAGNVGMAACAGIAGVYAALLAFPPARARLGDLAMALAPWAAIAAGGVGALGLGDPWAPFFAQSPGQMPLLALRVLVMLVVIVRAAHARAARFGLAAVAALLLASLVAQGYLVVLVAAGALVARRCARREAVATEGRARAWALAGVMAVAASGMRPRAGVAAAADAAFATPREEVGAWLARRNPYRARAVAVEWAKGESPPAEGYVALAKVDWQIGHRDRARKVLAKVLAGAAPEDVRREAEALARAWEPTETAAP